MRSDHDHLHYTSDCFRSLHGDDDVTLGEASSVVSSVISISSSSYVPERRNVGRGCPSLAHDDVTAGSECVDDVISASSCRGGAEWRDFGEEASVWRVDAVMLRGDVSIPEHDGSSLASLMSS